MTYTLDDDRRKLLTEKVLGEVWKDGLVGLPYTFEGVTNSHRSFTTPQDMHDVFKKLVDDKDWAEIRLYILLIWEDIPIMLHKQIDDDVATYDSDFESWLFYSPERFCWLVSEWLKEK
jgi:hypothetical protein